MGLSPGGLILRREQVGLGDDGDHLPSLYQHGRPLIRCSASSRPISLYGVSPSQDTTDVVITSSTVRGWHVIGSSLSWP